MRSHRKEVNQMKNNFSKIIKILPLSLMLLLMTSALLMNSPATAQTTYTNLQEGGSIALPSGTTPDNTEETRALSKL